jgi:hypothetical protein
VLNKQYDFTMDFVIRGTENLSYANTGSFQFKRIEYKPAPFIYDCDGSSRHICLHEVEGQRTFLQEPILYSKAL